MANDLPITTSEWEVMRIVWTLEKATSSEIINLLVKKRTWKASTVKTLIGRLVQKGMLTATKEGHTNTYQCAIAERTAMQEEATRLFKNMCAMKNGEVLAELIQEIQLSKSDIQKLQDALTAKEQTAPDQVACNCIPKEETTE
ncbi:Negative transcriptional regulator-copper transport operon [Pediococcus damnosus]|uniref:Negative transcriptional regulator-copper transport operon n=1 Tax=Pediococcus damnosus TaxID=51663 RepID=A0A0R2H5J0_9LACO|nr:CopY/TcrY family copper transport repressor [Pediococcus damnosus]AMV59877.1 Negative transcriptional regulator-copper transport operon [Pediococcus damnosus]AMV61831.1 Negative transcriptional regulator-copper transport operon [Pediococcus damnosus]AMV64123.1 Negative transcriptional regulator-copper transport operon [Pediococcus damnosus]AMV66296.1 Negative transcriptional regulator-copper transport operon [Pediococcus damnosus]KJU73977.1 uracil phosphoribosyltransferase [Pediococcus damn